MPSVNQSEKTISMKIAFCGPGQSGKTTAVEFIRAQRGLKEQKAVEADDDAENPSGHSGDETKTFKKYMFQLGNVKGFKVFVTMITVPGMIFHKAERGMLLQDVDAVVFVADSHPERVYANKVMLEQIREMLYEETRGDLSKVTFVLMYNKRDLPNATPIDEMEKFNIWKIPYVEATARTGEGVNDAFKKAVQGVLTRL
ncbi:MAG: gliding-motility protein MglA [Gemmatimonadetes bacterium]|nr:MAG: gliding-motility protein MglA [Gemmatimonadota bacterium]